MAGNTITIDGTDFTSGIPGIDDWKLEVGLDSEKGVVTFSSSDELDVVGTDAYNYIYDTWASDCSHVFEVTVYDACCDKLFDFFSIEPENIKVTPLDCKLTIELTSVTSDVEAFDALNKYIPVPNGTLSNPIGFGVFNGETGSADQVFVQYELFLVKDYMNYYCEQAGITFESSILVDDPIYSNTIIFHSGVSVAELRILTYENQHTMTPLEQLQRLEVAYNAKAVILNGVLRFERRDWYFLNENVSLFDIEELYRNGCAESPVYTISDESFNAYLDLKYTSDPTDRYGEGVLQERYSDIIEWNPTGSQALRGAKEVTIPFGATFGALLNFPHIVVSNFEYITEPKLWIWDGINQLSSDLINNPPDPYFSQNYPVFVDEQSPLDEIYKRFYSIEKPFEPYCIYEVDDVKVLPEDFCETIETIFDNGYNVSFTTRFGEAIPDKIRIDFAAKTIQLQGGKVYKNS